MSDLLLPAKLLRGVAYGDCVRRLWRLPFALSYCAPDRCHVVEWVNRYGDSTLHMAVPLRDAAEWIGDMTPLHLQDASDWRLAVQAIEAAEAWSVTEFFGRGDAFFGGTADDRPLAWDGRFVTGSYVPDLVVAWFPTAAQAMAAAASAPNRREGGSPAALRARRGCWSAAA